MADEVGTLETLLERMIRVSEQERRSAPPTSCGEPAHQDADHSDAPPDLLIPANSAAADLGAR